MNQFSGFHPFMRIVGDHSGTTAMIAIGTVVLALMSERESSPRPRDDEEPYSGEPLFNDGLVCTPRPDDTDWL